MSDDEDDKKFIEKVETESKKVLDEVEKRRQDVASSQQQDVRELRNILPDKKYELEKSLKKVETASEADKETAKKDAEKKLERVETIGGRLLDKVDQEEKKKLLK